MTFKSQNMRCLSIIILLMLAFSCKENEVNPTVDIYNEWEWVMTTYDTRGRPITSQETDTTYYYRFTQDGKIEIRDINKELKQQYNFKIIEDESFNSIVIEGLDETWGYSIVRDSLKIWEPLSIFPRTKHFKKN
jgi:hypothetical protein